MPTRYTLCAALVAALLMAGCVSGRPLLYSPGTMQQQQFRATLFDPYADTEAGPSVVGGRPREYQQPLSEPVRSQWFRNSWWAF
jgi:hypothetical protein